MFSWSLTVVIVSLLWFGFLEEVSAVPFDRFAPGYSDGEEVFRVNDYSESRGLENDNILKKDEWVRGLTKKHASPCRFDEVYVNFECRKMKKRILVCGYHKKQKNMKCV